MPERITKANLEARIENLNRRMTELGSVYRYQTQGRNGYTGLDRYIGEAMHNVVTVGTKSEVGIFLTAMMIALDDSARKA